MRQHIIVSIRMTLALLVLTCGVYPLTVWGVGQLAFGHQAGGSLITEDGRVIGSELIGQNFEDDRFFHPRPSAAGVDGYDASASGGSNLGPTSRNLRDALVARIVKLDAEKPAGGIPADAVTASASGLDPHISPENALMQAERVARSNGLALAKVQALIRARIEGRFLGIFGAPRVNVLLLNLEVRRAIPRV